MRVSRGWTWGVWVACVLLVGVGCTTAPEVVTPEGGEDRAKAERLDKEGIAPEPATGYRKVAPVRASKQMVGAANPYASRAGLEILEAGGSAVDAAIAMELVLGLVEPQSSGLGGGAFMLHYDAKARSMLAYDGRETAPAAATPDMFLGPDGAPRGFFDAVVGGLSVGVPGMMRMLEQAHKAHGKLPWARLMEPAIALADQGFEVSPRLHALLSRDPVLKTKPAARAYFYDASGAPWPVGHALTNPEYANVLRLIAKQGARAMYEGPLAAKIVKAVQDDPKNPGRLALADLKAYKPVVREPVCGTYRTRRVCGMPPPTSGGVTLLQMLGMLERFDLAAMGPNSVEAAHVIAEAARLAYADRGLYLADADFVDVPVEGLLNAQYLSERAALIQPARSMGEAEAGEPPGAKRGDRAPDASPELPSTTHMVVVDRDGNVVSMTATIETAFGSHVMVEGFLLNNELTDFSFVPEQGGRPVANRVEPGKRPRSSMAPLIVFDAASGEFDMALGSPGGSRIIMYVLQTLIHVVDWEMDMQQAMDRPHLVNRNSATELERVKGWEAWTEAMAAGLRERGHEVKVTDLNSGLHGIMKTSEGLLGGADPRREGVILGQ